MNISFITSSAEELIYKLLHFQLDAAFIKSSSINNDDLTEELAFEEKLVLISHPKCNEMKDVCCKPFLLNTPGCPNRDRLENWLKSEGIYNIRYMEFNNPDSIIEGVIADLGVSLVAESTIKKYERRGLLKSFPIPSQFSTSKTFFVRYKGVLLTSTLAKLIEITKSKASYNLNIT